jgi:hypothetical protein
MREREDDDGGEAGGFRELAEGEAEVGEHGMERDEGDGRGVEPNSGFGVLSFSSRWSEGWGLSAWSLELGALEAWEPAAFRRLSASM